MNTLFNKILGENGKYVFYFDLKPNELFGQPNTFVAHLSVKPQFTYKTQGFEGLEASPPF